MNGEPAPTDPCRYRPATARRPPRPAHPAHRVPRRPALRTCCARSSATTPNVSCTCTRSPPAGPCTAPGPSGSTPRCSAPCSPPASRRPGRTRSRWPRPPTRVATSSSAPAPRPARASATTCRSSATSSSGPSAPNGRGATALYLSPTKALAADQLSRIDRLALPAGPPRDVRRRHPDRRAPLDPRPRQPRAHQPRPAPPLAAARPRALELVPARAALRRRRRVPRLQGRLRRAPGGGAAAAAARRRALPRPSRPSSSRPPPWPTPRSTPHGCSVCR